LGFIINNVETILMNHISDKLPNHVAIIPDANRRWAKEKGLAPWVGHEEGAKNFKKILEEARILGIKYISFWGSSLDNFKKRPLTEKAALLKIYSKYFREIMESQEIIKNKIRVRVIGKWREQFPSHLVKIIDKCLSITKNFDCHHLTLLLAYSGDDEILASVKKIIRDKTKEEEINEDFFKKHLMTSELPPVDLLIRTGGEPHLSAGFMMWDMANAQLYFSNTKWPDFSKKEFREAIEDYSQRGRRFGK